MSFEEDLFRYLDNHAGLSREVDNRIYPLLLPQRPVFPAITYERITTSRLEALDRRSFLPHPIFQFDCWAESYNKVEAVAEQVRLALNMYSGIMGASVVEIARLINERDLYDATTKIWHRVVEVEIWYEG